MSIELTLKVEAFAVINSQSRLRAVGFIPNEKRLPSDATSNILADMRIIPQRIFPASALAVILTILAASAILAADHPIFAKLPYRTVAKLYRSAPSGPSCKVRLVVAIDYGDRVDDRSRPIELVLQSKTGPRPLTRRADGELIDFPLTDALWAEDPFILSNQPKGNLKLEGKLVIVFSGRLIESAAWYREALDQVNRVIKDQAGMMSFAAPRVKTIVFRFSPDGPAGVSLRKDAAETVLTPDADGLYRLDLSGNRWPDQTQIILARPPILIAAEE